MRPRILVVDDEPELQALLQIMLERDFEVSQALSGEEAVALARDSIPDLILLDVMLPDIDGFEVCHRLKADNHTRSIPIIFVTARADIFDCVEKQKLPVDDVIRKPFAPREFLQRVNKVLQRTAVDRESSNLRPSPAPA